MGHKKKGRACCPAHPYTQLPAPALGSLSSVALSSVQAPLTLAQTRAAGANYPPVLNQLSSGFLDEATNHVSSGFLREATGLSPPARSLGGKRARWVVPLTALACFPTPPRVPADSSPHWMTSERSIRCPSWFVTRSAAEAPRRFPTCGQNAAGPRVRSRPTLLSQNSKHKLAAC
jgi:hypothetical protein